MNNALISPDLHYSIFSFEDNCHDEFKKVALLISERGGQVLEQDLDDPYTIVLSDSTIGNDSNEQGTSDRFDVKFIRDSVENGQLQNLNNYLIGESLFHPYNANQILHRQIKWADVQKKETPNLMAAGENPIPNSSSNLITRKRILSTDNDEENEINDTYVWNKMPYFTDNEEIESASNSDAGRKEINYSKSKEKGKEFRTTVVMHSYLSGLQGTPTQLKKNARLVESVAITKSPNLSNSASKVKAGVPLRQVRKRKSRSNSPPGKEKDFLYLNDQPQPTSSKSITHNQKGTAKSDAKAKEKSGRDSEDDDTIMEEGVESVATTKAPNLSNSASKVKAVGPVTSTPAKRSRTTGRVRRVVSSDTDSAEQMPLRQVRKRKSRSNSPPGEAVSDFSVDYSSGVENGNRQNNIANLPRKPRKPYTKKEKETIIKFIIDKNLYRYTGGDNMWIFLERLKLVPGRTFQSMKSHFRKQILPNLKKINIINARVLRRFEAAKCFLRKNPRAAKAPIDMDRMEMFE